MKTPTTRRSWFSALALLALPRRGADPGHPLSDYPAERSDSVVTLDPSDPRAVALAKLWDRLREIQGPILEAKRAVIDHNQAGEHIKGDGPEWKAHCDESRRLASIVSEAEDPFRFVRGDLIQSVIDIHGGGLPTLEEWVGSPAAHRVVRTGRRLYSLSPCFGAEFPTHPDDDGDIELVIIDL